METLLNKNALCYFVLQSEIPSAVLAVGVVCSLVFIVEWLVGRKSDLYIEHKMMEEADEYRVFLAFAVTKVFSCS